MSHTLGCKEVEIMQVPSEIAYWCLYGSTADPTQSWHYNKANAFWCNILNLEGVMMADDMIGFVQSRFKVGYDPLVKYIAYILTLPGAITERHGKYGRFKYIDPDIFRHIRKLLTIRTLTWYMT